MNHQILAAFSHRPMSNVIPQSDGEFPGDSGLQDLRLSFKNFSAMRLAVHGRIKTKAVTRMGRADFIHHIVLHLPDVSARIADDDFGILHLEMGVMRLATRDAIQRYELHAVRRHFAFIAYLYEHADNELYDAITVSYLEALFIDEDAPQYKNARSLLPPSLAEALRRADLRYTLLRNTWSAPALDRVPDFISPTLY